jgi:hypothetical protein
MRLRTDDYFFAHLYDGTKDDGSLRTSLTKVVGMPTSPAEDDGMRNELHSSLPKEDERKPAAVESESHIDAKDDTKPAAKSENCDDALPEEDERKPAAAESESHSDAEDDTKLAAKSENCDSNTELFEMYDPPRSEWGRVSSGYGLFSIEEGWAQRAELNRGGSRDNDVLPCRLYCKYCHAMAGVTINVLVGNKAYIHRFRNSLLWYTHMFINGFIALVQHDAHMSIPPHKNPDHRIMLVYKDYSRKLKLSDILDYGAQHILFLWHSILGILWCCIMTLPIKK